MKITLRLLANINTPVLVSITIYYNNFNKTFGNRGRFA